MFGLNNNDTLKTGDTDSSSLEAGKRSVSAERAAVLCAHKLPSLDTP